VAKISTDHHIYIPLYMVVPALLLAGWWALGGWGKRVCVEETGVGRGREDGDWRDRGRMDGEMGKYYLEISDRSGG
jgi:hypothetical protein